MVDSTQVHELPQILLVSEDPKLLTERLTQRGCLKDTVWHFSTKYYDADVSLVKYSKDNKYEKVEAIIFLFKNTADLLLMSNQISDLME